MAAEIPSDKDSSSKAPEQVLSQHDTKPGAETHGALHREWMVESRQKPAGADRTSDQNTANAEQTARAAISTLDQAKRDFTKEGATPKVRQEFEAAIKAAEATDASLDKTKLQTEIDRVQGEIKKLDLDGRTAEVERSIDDAEKSLPPNQRQKLTAIDKGADAVIQQHDALIAAIKDRAPTQAEQKTLLGYETQLDQLGQRRGLVYQLPADIVKKRDALNEDYERAAKLNETILKDNALIHFASVFRASYAEVLNASGDQIAADQQMQKIAVADPSFFGKKPQDSVDPSMPGVGTLEANRLMKQAQNLVVSNKGLTPEARVLFEQAKQKADAQFDADKSNLQAKIQDVGKRLEGVSAKLAPYDTKLGQWLAQNPETKKNWAEFDKQINEANTKLYTAQLTDKQREELQQHIAELKQERTTLLPPALQQLNNQLLPEQHAREAIRSELIDYAMKLGGETEATVWVRAYEAAALKQSGDDKQAQQLLEEAMDKAGGNPQMITQFASDLQQSDGMDAAKPVFQAAIDAADLAYVKRQAKVQNEALWEAMSAGTISPADYTLAHSENPAWPETKNERLIATAPDETRRAYAFALFNSANKEEAISMFKQMHSNNLTDPWTAAALQVAQDPKTSKITNDEINDHITAMGKQSQYSYYAAMPVDIAVTGLAVSKGVPPVAAAVLGTLASVPVFAGTEYLLNGRIPGKGELAVYVATAGIGAAVESVTIPVVTSGVIRALGTRAASKVQPILEALEPETATALSGLRGSERILATKDAAGALYAALRSGPYRRMLAQDCAQLWRTRIILGVADKAAPAVGIGGGIAAGNYVIGSMYEGLHALSAAEAAQLRVPPSDIKE